MKHGPFDPREYATPVDDALHTAWGRFRSSQFARDLPWLLFTAAISTLVVLAAIAGDAFGW